MPAAQGSIRIRRRPKDGTSYSPNLIKSKVMQTSAGSDHRPASTSTKTLNANGETEFKQELLVNGGNHNQWFFFKDPGDLVGPVSFIFRPNTTYTVSFDYRATSTVTTIFDIRKMNNQNNLQLGEETLPASTEWKRAWIRGTLDSTPITTEYVRCLLCFYLANGTGVVGDTCELRNLCIVEGENTEWVPSADSMNPYTVILSNENHTFVAGEYKVETAQSVTSELKVFKGSTPITAKITSTSGSPLAVTYPSGTSGGKITFTAPVGLAERSGQITITFVADNQTFTKVFSWTLALKGASGDDAVAYSIETSTPEVILTPEGKALSGPIKLKAYKTVGSKERTDVTGTMHFTAYGFTESLAKQSFAVPATGNPREINLGITNPTIQSITVELRTSASSAVAASLSIPVSVAMPDGAQLLRNTDFVEPIICTDKVLFGKWLWDGDAEWQGIWDTEPVAPNKRTSWLLNTEGSKTLRQFVGNVVPGAVYTLSGYGYDVDGSGVYLEAYAGRLVVGDIDGQLLGRASITTENWGYESCTFRVPVGVSELTVVIAGDENQLAINSLKLERGMSPTPWSPHALDGLLIREAAQEGPTVNAGLVLSRLLLMGCDADGVNGNFEVHAGMSGLMKKPEDVAIWAGGNPIDAATSRASSSANRAPVIDTNTAVGSTIVVGGIGDITEPTDDANRDSLGTASDATPAMMLVRHDGTGYFCGNRIRFDRDRITVGNDVVLDQDGFTMFGIQNGQRVKRVRIVNGDIANFSNLAAQYNEYDLRKPIQCKVCAGSGAAILTGFRTITMTLGTAGTGMTANVSGCGIEIIKPASLVDLGAPAETATLKLECGQTVKTTKIVTAKFIDNGFSWVCRFPEASIQPGVSGNVTLEISVATQTAMTAEYACSGNIQGAAKVQTSEGRSETVLANNGFITQWGTAQILAKSDGITMKCGDVVFSITSQGIVASRPITIQANPSLNA